LPPSVLLPKAKWKPTYHTPRRHKVTDGSDVAAFASQWLTVTKGVRAGQPLEFTEWQSWLLDSLLERRLDGSRRYSRALVGLPRKQGKSLMGSALALYGLFAGEAGAEVYSAAGDRQQARIVFNEARLQVLNSPVLTKECNVYRDAIEVPSMGAVYRVLSSDSRLQHGLNPSLVIFDELWVQKTEDLWDALTLGSGARVDPLVVAITTAGFDLDTVGGRLYQYGKQVAANEMEDDYFGFWWWEAPAEAAITDEKAWAVANPNLSLGLIDLQDFKTAAKQTTETSFRRFRMNQWVRSQESWLPAGAWENLTVPEVAIDPDLPCFVGIDMALKHDSIAVVIAQQQVDKVAVTARIWLPDQRQMDVAEVEHHLRELHQKYSVIEFAYDPAYFERSAEILIDEGLPMLQFPQSAARMVPACGHAYELIVSGKLVHDGAPVFTDQVLSAAQRLTDQGWRLSKGKSRRKIDAAIAMVMAVDRATRRHQETNSPQVMKVW
jgi:phage terminase large subunit-like protein